MTLLETSRKLDQHYFSTWRAVKTGKLKATFINGVYNIEPSALDEFIKNRRPAGRPKR